MILEIKINRKVDRMLVEVYFSRYEQFNLA